MSLMSLQSRLNMNSLGIIDCRMMLGIHLAFRAIFAATESVYLFVLVNNVDVRRGIDICLNTFCFVHPAMGQM